MFRSIISLRVQLLLAIVGSIAATAVALATLAYRTQTSSLRSDAEHTVHVAAMNRAESVERLVGSQQERATRFLSTAAALCGELLPSGRTVWEIGCAADALREFRTGERATGAVLARGSRRIARSGAAPSLTLPVPTPLARLITTPSGPAYVVRAVREDAEVRLQFSMSDISLLFEQTFGLGAGGDVFLRDAVDQFLTPPRSAGGTSIGAQREFGRDCVEPSEWTADDYRGHGTFHGVYPVSAFSQPTCVDAHVEYDEALAPASTLLNELLTRAVLLGVVGVILALGASRWMIGPLRRLADSARALTAGEFARPVPAGGPSEVRELARCLAAMASALGEQISREQSARQEAERANRVKDEFLAVLSHELRTPLTSTLGWTRLLRRGQLDAVRAERAISAIERSAEMQRRLIEDLVDVSRIVAGRLHIERTTVRLIDPVRAAVEEQRPMVESKGLGLDLICDASPLIRGDPLRLRQIVTNLVVNSAKFTAAGRITVRVRETAGRAELSVSDTGIGIDPAFLPCVFEKFRQADSGPTRAYGGLGLGLSIVQHLVTMHGGVVRAMSPGVGEGATFVVEFAVAASGLAPEPAADARVAPGDARSVAAEPDERVRLDDVRVLLVEDDDDTRLVVAALLAEAGAVVDTAATAAEGRKRLQSSRYSAIVSDIAMPEEDGLAFLRSVRRTDDSIPAIALTALSRRDDATKAQDAGFQVFLTKPVHRDKLIRSIADLTLRKTA
jgi:signal transduction histidine kinase/ActR/RegA family two-component response regulator